MDVAGAIGGLSEADSYKVQFAVHDKICAGGKDKVAGWKIALTLPQMYEPLRLSGPVFAAIYQSGLRQSGTVFESGYPIKPGIEPELVARISKRSEEHTSELQSLRHLVCRLLLEKKKQQQYRNTIRDED